MADAKILVEIAGDASKLNTTLQEAQGKLQNAFGKMKEVGKTLTTAVTLPLAGIGTAAVNAAMEFNNAMANIAALIPGNAERIEELKDQIQTLAKETGKSSKDLAAGMYEIISAFGDSEDAIDKLRIAVQAAKAGVADTKDAVSLLSAVTKAYGDTSAEALQYASDLALKTVQLGQTTFPELAEGLKKVAPIASTLGVDLEELHAVFATLTGVTGDANEVATQFRALLTEMIKPSKELQQVIEQLGYESGQQMIEAMGGLVPALQKVYEATGSNAERFSQLLGRVEGINAALALVGPQADTFNEKMSEMGEAAGFTEEAFKAQTEGVNAAGYTWEKFRATLETFMQEVGDKLLPVLSRLLDKVSGLLDWFTKLDPAVQDFLLVIAGGAAAGGPIMNMVGAIGQATNAFKNFGGLFASGGMLGPYGLVAIGVAAVATLIITHWDDIKEALTKAWNYLKEKAEQIWGGIKNFFSNIWEGIQEYNKAYMEAVHGLLSGIWEKTKGAAQTIWGGMKSFFLKVWDGIQEYNKAYMETVKSTLETIWGGIKSAAQTIWGGLKSFFKSVWDGIKEDFKSKWQSITDTLSNIWGSIKEKAAGLWEGIKGVFSRGSEEAEKIVEESSQKQRGLWQRLSDALVGHSIVPDMVDAINIELARIDVDPVIEELDKLELKFQETAENVSQSTKDIAKQTEETMQGLLGVIGDIGNIAIDMQFGEQPTIGQIGGIFTGILGLFASIPGIIVNFFSMLFGWLERYQQKIKEMVDSVLEYMESGIKAFFSAPTIYDAITGFGENLRKVVYQMLVDAITQAIIASEAVRDAAKELGKTINEAIKEATATGIFDPQTFINIAGPAIQAYAQFWQQTMLPVLQQTYAYLQPYNPSYAGGYETVSGTFPSYQSGGYVRTTGLALLHEGEYVVPRGGVAFGNVSIAINVQNGDPRRIAREIWDELEYEARRRGIALAR
ncbi:phage tail tape measure protein [Atrimonas thermophila]|uniref:phage tail tape measure protein n=1 Tax=Atrimonas thermophila TaxID=3064161 RepID=UPI00399C4C66